MDVIEKQIQQLERKTIKEDQPEHSGIQPCRRQLPESGGLCPITPRTIDTYWYNRKTKFSNRNAKQPKKIDQYTAEDNRTGGNYQSQRDCAQSPPVRLTHSECYRKTNSATRKQNNQRRPSRTQRNSTMQEAITWVRGTVPNSLLHDWPQFN